MKISALHVHLLRAHIVAATPAGCTVESFTDPVRDPLQAELFEHPPRISNGMLTLKEQPGLGLILSEAPVSKFSERIP